MRINTYRYVLALLLLAAPALAQPIGPPASLSGTITSTTCSGTPGSGTGCVVLNVTGYASAAVQVSAIGTQTLGFFGSINGTDYTAIPGTLMSTGATASTTTTTGLWLFSLGGAKYLKVAGTAYTSGTASVYVQTAASGGGTGGGGGGTSSTVTINDPTIPTQKAAVNASGQLSITCANCSGSGASAVDESVFTQGTNSVAPAGIFFSNSYTNLTSGQAGVVQGTANGSMFVNLDKIQGTNADVNSGSKSAGTLRVVLATDQPQLTNALKVDGSAVTQPVSAASLPLPAGASTSANQTNRSQQTQLSDGAGNARSANVTAANALVVDGSGVTQPVSGTVTTTPPANASTNVTQLAGNAITTNTGTAAAGTQRIVIATDQPQLTNALKVDGSAVTQPVSGTVTANAGSGTFTNQQSNVTADFDTGGGTQTTTMFGLALPASGGAVAGGTATNPIQVSLANTAANATAVKVDGSAVTQPVSGTITTTPPANASTNVTQFGGVNVSTGTGASGTGIPRVTVANDSNVLATQSGTWTTQPGNTANTTPWLFTVNQGGNSATVTGANALKVDGSAVTQPVSGTVTANIGTTNGLALDASVTGLQVAQGSTTAGEKGGLSLGAVTTSAPSYTTAQTSPLSLTTTGGLRVDGSGTTQPVSGTVAATQSGTWTVQPGNTANTTPWLTSISQGGNTAAVNASSQLSVNCANCSGSGVSQQDNTGFTPGTTNVAPIGAEVDDVGTTPVTENSAGGLRMSTRREMYTQIRDAAGNERGVNVTAANAMSVDGSAVTQPVSLATGASADLTQLLIDQRRQTSQLLDGLKKVRLTDRIGAFIDPRQTRLLTALDIVTCANCTAGSGGTAIVDNAAFTQSSTSETPASGLYTTSYTAATSGRSTVQRMSSGGDAYVNINLLQNAVPSATNYLPFRPTDGTNYITPSTDYTHDGALTPASTTGPMGLWRASSSTPTAVSASDDAVMGWADLNGRPQVNISQIGGTGLFSNNGTASGSTFVATLPAVATTAAPSYTDGRMVTLSTDLSGALRVSGGSGGTSIVDNAAFTQSSTNETPVSGLYTTSYTAATSGRSTVLQMTSAGEAYTNISKLQGAVPSATNYLPFRPTDGTNYITPSTDYTHDVALTPASTTGPMGLWRASTATPTAVSADDDAVMAWADRNGRPQINTSQIAGVTPTLGDVNNAAAIAGVQNVGAVARYNATLPTLTDTRYNLFQVGSRGGLHVNILDKDGTTGASVTATGLKVDVGGAGALTATSSALDTNLKLVGGNAVSTVASGVAKVGIADSGGTAFLSAANALNSTGGGVQAVQTVAQFDDVAPTAITENQFGNLRMSANRNAYSTIRDAAGNERGANVSAGNALLVDGSATTQPVSGTVTTTPPANASTNVTQFASTNVSTGTGASGAGIPRVTVANDSNILATQSGTWTVQPGNTANTTPWLSTISQGGNAATVSAGGALKVDGSAATQPVSGTVTANQGGAPWAENITQFGSSAVVTGTGVGGAGIPRMTVSSDSTLTSVGSITNTVTAQGTKTNNNAAPGATNYGTLPGVATAAAPTYVEGNQVALSTDLTGALRVSGSSGGGVAQTQVRNQSNTWTDVGYASGDTTMPITASAVEALLAQLIRNEQAQQNYVRGAFGNKIGSVNDALKVNVTNSPGRYDPCQGPKSNVAISQAANGVVLTGIPGRVLFCSLVIVAADAENLSLVEGSGSTCGTGTAALIGGTTAANGPNLAANGGWSEGGSGNTIAPQIKMGNDVCLFQSGSGRVAGHATYVVVPQ